ncbi:DUF3500 domain-containing protein [Compostibacter hankyongensis]|uniref:DUF3500 domain-containing protein n=1 Tax=Compostibacter hankyongensis TaxID=1007089 RepID=A0ABP8FC05_9BACT
MIKKSCLFLWVCLLPGYLVRAQEATLQDTIAVAARQFVDSLRPDQRRQALLTFDDPERLRWGNEPENLHARKGLKLEEMSDRQKRLTHRLLLTVLSEQGYLKLANVIRLDDWLKKNYYKPPVSDYYGSGWYRLAVFGTPGKDQRWGWRFEGHHFSLSVTVSPKGVSVTPFFLGSHPAVLPDGPLAGLENMPDATHLAWQLLQSLDAGQQKQAVLGAKVPGDVQAHTGKEDFITHPQGIPATALNAGQQSILKALIRSYTGNLRPSLADKYYQTITGKEWGQLRFAWIGGTAPGSPFYYRLLSPGNIIEYCSRMQDQQHIHTLWRMPAQDFGGAL